MIMASEAAERSMKVIYDHGTEELKRIEDGIEARIKMGEREYYYEGSISPIAKAEMERCGFVIKIGNQYNQSYVTIKW